MTDDNKRDPLSGVDRNLDTDLQHLITEVRDKRIVQRYYEQNPYVVLAAAAGVGYIAGGGLFSPFTRRLVRVGMKALFVPIAATQLKALTGGDGS